MISKRALAVLDYGVWTFLVESLVGEIGHYGVYHSAWMPKLRPGQKESFEMELFFDYLVSEQLSRVDSVGSATDSSLI